MNKTAHTKSANVFLAVGDLLRTLRGVGGLGKVEQALTNPVAMGRRSVVGNIGKAVAAPVLAPALGVMGVASKVDRAAKAHDPLRLLQMRSREAAVKGMSNRPVDRRQFVTDMMRGLLNPDVRQAVGTLGTAAVRGAASLAEKIASMEKSAAEHDGLSVSEGVVNPLRIGADSFVGYKALKGAARTLLNPSEMYHGTSTEHLPGIIRDGLKPHNNVAKWVALKAEKIDRLQDALRRNGVPENSIQRDVADELTRLEKIKQNLSTPKTFLSKGFFGGRTEAKSYAESAAHAAPGSQGVVLSTTLTPDELRRAVPDVITSRSGAWNKPDIHNFSVDWTIPSRRVYKGTPSLWGLIRGRSPEILKNLKANGAFRAAFGLGALGVAGLAGLDAVRTGKRTADKLTQEKSAALTPFERLGGIAAPMEKEAGVPTGLLRSFLRGQKPLFHAMSGENAKGLLKMPRALTSTEAIERGLASNIESGAGFGRGGAPTRASIIRPTLGDGSATISVPELVASNAKEKLGYLSGDLLDYAPTRALAKLRMPNHALQSGAASELASQLNTGASKNWGNISFSEGAPFRGYGEFGIMTTPSRVTGGQTKSLWSPVWEGKEVQARPNWIPGASGVPETLQLPSAPGKIFYHPSVDNAPMVRQLHAQYGRQNVIPWNSRTKRQMLNMGGELQHHPRVPADYGDISYMDMVKQHPEFPGTMAQTKDVVRGWLNKSAASTLLEKLARYRRLDHARLNPSQAQIASQNFKMGHVDFHGLDLTIENEKGSVRRGTTKEGKKWESVLTCPYGYIRSAAGGKSGERVRPKARDGDHIDVFVGPNKSSELVVAIDQYLDGKYDESKFLLGCDSQDEGVQLYRSNYQRGWPDMPASTCTFAQFKEWLKNGDHKKPFKGQMVKAASRLG